MIAPMRKLASPAKAEQAEKELDNILNARVRLHGLIFGRARELEHILADACAYAYVLRRGGGDLLT